MTNKLETWKIKILKNCDECGKLIKVKRFRRFCSGRCRQKNTNRRHYKYQREWASKKRGQYGPGKVRCILCNRWYVQVCSHVYQAHQITGREYRECFDLPVKRGVIPKWYRKIKGDMVFRNKTVNNLKNGKKFWYVKNDPRAIKNTGYKGQSAQIKKLSQDIYPH